MTVKPRTIDNLGIETSSRYARDQAQLDTKLIEESRLIPLKTEVSVVKPYLPTEFEQYLLPSKPTIWASFEPPPTYFGGAGALFSYQLIPSLGGYEKQDADAEKLEALEDTIHKQMKEGKRDQRESQDEEKERKKLLGFLKVVGKLERTLSLINARRNQYQRG
ncbi:MAG: DUF5399 domain-containing protein [Verrucomicrobia bacterium]|nr:DUF5399 domain-containing protein [Verrucomicrobiota bacterium]MBU6445911.1 DUF5399 domain-containing protein [Verrucomicrobiota bacterium]MDE3046973.1 DUF5399 family protein [Verrucomicrobiota bacterium]